MGSVQNYDVKCYLFLQQLTNIYCIIGITFFRNLVHLESFVLFMLDHVVVLAKIFDMYAVSITQLIEGIR